MIASNGKLNRLQCPADTLDNNMLHPSRVGCRNLKSHLLTRLGELGRYPPKLNTNERIHTLLNRVNRQ